jgi:hypothetical protein
MKEQGKLRNQPTADAQALTTFHDFYRIKSKAETETSSTAMPPRFARTQSTATLGHAHHDLHTHG